MRPLLLLALLAGACTACSKSDPEIPVDLCSSVSCTVEGTRCDPSDGACKCGDVAACGTGEVCVDSVCVVPTPERCTAGTEFAAGVPAFRDATTDWGLDAIQVAGTRVAVGDFDADGWPDLFVRAGGNGADDFGADGVRRSWLLLNTGASFVDVTESSGIRATRTTTIALGRPGEVVAFADVDNDGDLDVYTGMSTGIDGALAGETSELMLNDGSANFSLGPSESELRRADDVDIPAGASFVDYDRDGFIDLWITQHNYTPAGQAGVVFRPDFLYRGDGTGLFSEIGSDVGISTTDWNRIADIDAGRAHSRAWSAAACDLNGDGNAELLAASYGRAPNLLWQAGESGGQIGYSNMSVASGYAFDENQSWETNEFARCFCASNPAAEGCDAAPPPRISCTQQNWRHTQDRRAFRLGGNSGTTVCADVDNDGDLDLLTTEITHWWAGDGADRSELLLNSGSFDVRFDRPGPAVTGIDRPTPAANWDHGDMTAAVFDFDNDGWLDVYIGASDYAGNRGLLYHQDEPGHFNPVAIEDGVDHHRSHGVVYADFDRDGDLDLLVGHSRSRCDESRPANCYETRQVRLFENLLGQNGNWIQLDLVGMAANRSAVGARVTVQTPLEEQTQEVSGGFGHYGIQNDRILHFGLGSSCTADVTVRWPNRELSRQTFSLETGYRYRIIEGEMPVRVESL